MKIDIIPAVLPHSAQELGDALERLRGIAPLVQIDIVEPTLLAEHEALPHWEEFDFEFDLMVPDPAAMVPQIIALGASRIVIHLNNPHARVALERAQDNRGGNYPVAIGAALQAQDAPATLEPFVGLYDYVQVMGIEHEGSQGQPPAGQAVELVRALRAAHPDLTIQVDGAVAPRVRELVEAGASRLVVGSAIVNAEDPESVYKELYTLANA